MSAPLSKREIADRAMAVLANRERATGITGNMFADDDCVWFVVAEMPKNLRGLAIKSFAELDIWRNRLRPPIAFHMSILFDVAHDG